MPAIVNAPTSNPTSNPNPSQSYYDKLHELVTLYGIKLSQSYTPDSDPEVLQVEYANQIAALDAKNDSSDDDSNFIADSLYAALLSLPFF